MSNITAEKAVLSGETKLQQLEDKELLTIYSNQTRECWLCEKIAADLKSDKEISDDDRWHFSSCVLSWEHINRLNEK